MLIHQYLRRLKHLRPLFRLLVIRHHLHNHHLLLVAAEVVVGVTVSQAVVGEAVQTVEVEVAVEIRVSNPQHLLVRVLNFLSLTARNKSTLLNLHSNRYHLSNPGKARQPTRFHLGVFLTDSLVEIPFSNNQAISSIHFPFSSLLRLIIPVRKLQLMLQQHSNMQHCVLRVINWIRIVCNNNRFRTNRPAKEKLCEPLMQQCNV